MRALCASLGAILVLTGPALAQRIQITESQLYGYSDACRALAEQVAERDGYVQDLPPDEVVRVINDDAAEACAEMSESLGGAPAAGG